MEDKKQTRDIEDYVLQKGEEISIIKYKNKRGKRLLRKCKRCGRIFETLLTKVKAKGEHFCSIDCYILYLKENSLPDKEKKKRNILYQKKSKYNLNEEEYNNLFLKQGNSCAICGKPFNEERKGFVDHSHETGKVRGILCSKCNTLIGMANEETNILENAIKYINNNKG